MNAYHVVTDKPKYIGQQIIFDEEHHSGVFQKVQDKLNFVNDIYSNPIHKNITLKHRSSYENRTQGIGIRRSTTKKYPQFSSRLSCLYVSKILEEADQWVALSLKSDVPLIML